MTSTAIYTCYRQLHPPTGVDHAIFGSVTAVGSRDLIVAKASILELYRVHRVDPKENATADNPAAAAAAAAGGGGTGDDDGDDTGFYLELAGTFPLAGNITSLAVLPVASSLAAASSAAAAAAPAAQPPRRQQDVLVVSFGAAKMALVAYDALLGRLETVSIHNFDAGAIGPGAAGVETGYGLASALKNRPGTITSADPAGRCLAAVVAGYQLVVVPARRYVPRSVFVSEESAERRRALRARRRAAAAAAAAAAEARGTEEGGVSFNNGVGGGDAGRAAGGDSGSEGDDSVGGGESESEVDEDEEGGDGSGAHAAVAKPFTIDLEEAGVTG